MSTLQADYPSCVVLGAQAAAAPSSGIFPAPVIVPVQAAGTKPPLYFVHGVGGGMLWGYEALARHLGPDQPVYFFQCRAARGLPEHESIEAMAAEYVAALLRFHPEGPYHIGGYCFGGNVAFEMARQLRRAGADVGAVVLINSVPANCAYDRMRCTPGNLLKFVRNLGYWAVQLSTSRTARGSELLAWKMRTLLAKGVRWCRLPARRRGLHTDELVALADLPDPAHRARWIAHLCAFYRFTPQPYEGDVLLLRTRGHQLFCTFAPDYGWQEFVRGAVHIRVLQGEHESMLQAPHVATVARELRAELQLFNGRAGAAPASGVTIAAPVRATMPSAGGAWRPLVPAIVETVSS